MKKCFVTLILVLSFVFCISATSMAAVPYSTLRSVIPSTVSDSTVQQIFKDPLNTGDKVIVMSPSGNSFNVFLFTGDVELYWVANRAASGWSFRPLNSSSSVNARISCSSSSCSSSSFPLYSYFSQDDLSNWTYVNGNCSIPIAEENKNSFKNKDFFFQVTPPWIVSSPELLTPVTQGILTNLPSVVTVGIVILSIFLVISLILLLWRFLR